MIENCLAFSKSLPSATTTLPFGIHLIWVSPDFPHFIHGPAFVSIATLMPNGKELTLEYSLLF
jgi:hypothetical protein